MREVKKYDRLKKKQLRHDLGIQPILQCTEQRQLSWWVYLQNRQQCTEENLESQTSETI